MINQIEKLRFPIDRHFIIEISLIMTNIQKKFIISLFISDNIKVKELKEFISKDFDLPVKNMIFYNSLEGILQDSFEFQFEQDKKINLSLILNHPKKSASELNYINILKNEEIQKNINEYKIIKKNEINKTVVENNEFLKLNDLNKEIKNSSNSKNEDLPNNAINTCNNGIKNFINNKKEKINEKIKNDKFNFFSTKISEKKRDLNHALLNKKRNISPYQTKISKNIIKNNGVEENTKKIKINFNINKAINKSEVDKINLKDSF